MIHETLQWIVIIRDQKVVLDKLPQVLAIFAITIQIFITQRQRRAGLHSQQQRTNSVRWFKHLSRKPMADPVVQETGNQTVFDEADIGAKPVRNHEFAL